MVNAKASIIIHSASELVTCSDGLGESGPRRGRGQGELGVVANGAVAIGGEHILAVGSSDAVLANYRDDTTQLIDATGCTVTPGLVDAHTHLVWSGYRDEEYELRLQGAGYLQILAAGGGIISTVRATRTAHEDELKSKTAERLTRLLEYGTTTVEIKSGYGLSVEDELKCLWAVRDLNIERQERGTGPRIAATFLGAHAVPEEYAGNADGYVDLVIKEMLPTVAAEGLAEWCDVFCDEGAFTAEQARRILTAAKELGMGTRLHANEFARIGAVEVAAEMRCSSADHLLLMDDADIATLREAGTMAVLCPGTPFGLGLDHYAPARKLIEAGVPVALATDCNPGTCPSENLPLMMALACTQMKMTPAEALVAATINGAYALDRGNILGSLEPGKLADIVIWSAPNHRHLAYHFGVNLVESIFVGGNRVV